MEEALYRRVQHVIYHGSINEVLLGHNSNPLFSAVSLRPTRHNSTFRSTRI